MIVGNGAAGVWALVAHRYAALRSRALWLFTALVEVAVFVQVVVGVVLVAGQKLKVPKFHQFYGYLALVSVAIIYSYRDQVARKYLYLLYGGGGLFIMGLAIRALIVGRT